MKNNKLQKGFAVPMVIGIIVLVLAGVGIGYYAFQKQAGEKEETMMEENMEEMMEGEMMSEEGFELIEGKMMMVNEKNKTMTMMEKDMVLHDGTMVKINGEVVRSDGTIIMLKEGESIWMDGMIMKAGEMMGDGKTMMKYNGAVLAGKSAPLLDFNKVDYEEALKTDKLIVLYFYANWCPTCRVEFPIVQNAFNELKTEDVIGFRVNYNDNQTDNDERNLARQFGVAYQHTKVFVKNGERILKSPESWNKNRYLSEINNYQ